MDWKKEITIAHMVRQKIAEVDVAQIWLYPYPEVAATEKQVLELERKLEMSLSLDHKEFLLHANGWRSFYQAVDLFGIEELQSGSLHNRAQELLNSLGNLKDICGFDVNEVLPIAVSTEDIDLFLITNQRSRQSGLVFWFAGQLIDHFSSFEEWFLAMVDYNRLEYQGMIERN